MEAKAKVDIRFGDGYRLRSDSCCYFLERVQTNEDAELFVLVGLYNTTGDLFAAILEGKIPNCGGDTIFELSKKLERIKQEEIERRWSNGD